MQIFSRHDRPMEGMVACWQWAACGMRHVVVPMAAIMHHPSAIMHLASFIGQNHAKKANDLTPCPIGIFHLPPSTICFQEKGVKVPGQR
jgi:hypothetical protein